MQEVVERRCQQHSDHRQEKHAAEQRITNRKDLRRWCRDGVQRTHAGENHRRIQCCIQPRQSVEHVVPHRAYSQRGKDKRADNPRVPDKSMNERAAQGTLCEVGHVDEYRVTGPVARTLAAEPALGVAAEAAPR